MSRCASCDGTTLVRPVSLSALLGVLLPTKGWYTPRPACLECRATCNLLAALGYGVLAAALLCGVLQR